ncbi:MAG: hypothetical protein IPP56_00695 [Bacteroidetes bacterium]|nr:hypothetical protein [Bacteroidota bacterium]
MRFVLFLIALLSSSFLVMAQDTLPELAATRTNNSPKIDGIISDSCWKNLPIATNFTVSEPVYGSKPSAITKVKYCMTTVQFTFVRNYMICIQIVFHMSWEKETIM